MKHNIKITLLLLAMFVVTQFIGLYVVSQYTPYQIINGNEIQNVTHKLPYGFQPPTDVQPVDALKSFIFALILAVFLVFFLTKIRASVFLKLWFFVVVIIALGITINTIIPGGTQPLFLSLTYSEFIALFIAIPLAFYKIYQRNLLVHNLTELLIYPGLAAIFVPVLSNGSSKQAIGVAFVLLILISIYDIYAVWHAGFMQKMAKYQIEHLKIFAGFFVPYFGNKEKEKIQKMSQQELKTKKVKVSVAILGGGDVVFPIITSGIMWKFLGFWPALAVIIGATLGLTYLFFFAEKGKFYPAMPYISGGIFLSLGAWYLISLI